MHVVPPAAGTPQDYGKDFPAKYTLELLMFQLKQRRSKSHSSPQAMPLIAGVGWRRGHWKKLKKVVKYYRGNVAI